MRVEHAIRQRPRALALACALAFAAAGLSRADAQPVQQPDRPNIANDVERREGGETRPAEPTVRTPNGRRPRGTPRPAPGTAHVVFKADQPGTEIFVKRATEGVRSLGKTNSEGRLSARLPLGQQQVIALRPGTRVERRQIDVRPDGNEFTFNLVSQAQAPPPKEEADATPAPTPEPSPTPEQATDGKSSVSPDEVVARFLDAKDSEAVTADDWQQAQEQTRAALATDPDNARLKARGYVADGQLAFLRGDHASALVAFNKAVIASPDYVAAHYGLGNAYLATNQPAEAFRAYQRAAALEKEFALAYKGMGDALTKQNKTREAAEYYKRATSFGQSLPTNTGLTAARELKKRKKWGEALKQFEEIARTDPSSEVYVDIGDCYTGLEQPLSASRAYLKATELDPKSAVASYKYGEVMFKLREWAPAMEALERALALDTTGAAFNRKQARERANEAAKKLGLKND